jgi:tRNA pseudouridine32 synthase / 23S rRNA pseudouridine746 synthase
MNPKAMTGDEMLARVLYRDGLMLVVDKPAGLSVHRGPKGGASLEDFFDALRFGLPRDPALAHRLDRETSGCLVLGRHRKALAHLGLLFKHRKVGKTYWAVVEGGPTEDVGTIDLALGRLDETRGWWMKVDPKGVPAVTKWKVMGRSQAAPQAPRPSHLVGEVAPPKAGREGDSQRGELSPRPPPQPSPKPIPGLPGDRPLNSDPSRKHPTWVGEGAHRPSGESIPDLTWLALEPITGRTHQLRVHCAAMGFPIVGDAIYGTAPRIGGPPLQLHAREVVVPISKNKPPVRVIAPVPGHIGERLTACGWNETTAA